MFVHSLRFIYGILTRSVQFLRITVLHMIIVLLLFTEGFNSPRRWNIVIFSLFVVFLFKSPYGYQVGADKMNIKKLMVPIEQTTINFFCRLLYLVLELFSFYLGVIFFPLCCNICRYWFYNYKYKIKCLLISSFLFLVFMVTHCFLIPTMYRLLLCEYSRNSTWISS